MPSPSQLPPVPTPWLSSSITTKRSAQDLPHPSPPAAWGTWCRRGGIANCCRFGWGGAAWRCRRCPGYLHFHGGKQGAGFLSFHALTMLACPQTHRVLFSCGSAGHMQGRRAAGRERDRSLEDQPNCGDHTSQVSASTSMAAQGPSCTGPELCMLDGSAVCVTVTLGGEQVVMKCVRCERGRQHFGVCTCKSVTQQLKPYPPFQLCMRLSPLQGLQDAVRVRVKVTAPAPAAGPVSKTAVCWWLCPPPR